MPEFTRLRPAAPKPGDYVVVPGSQGPRRDFRISVGLSEGWDPEGRVFDVSEAVRTARAWMRRRVEAGQPAGRNIARSQGALRDARLPTGYGGEALRVSAHGKSDRGHADVKSCLPILVCDGEPRFYARRLSGSEFEQATMTVAFLVTSDLDLALTKVAEGRPVLYCGPHQGVFRFESVKAVALRRFHASSRPACVLGLPEGEEAALRKFLVGA